MRLPRAFYERPTLIVLEEIIGKVLVHDIRGVRTAGVIVEAEAYIGEDDPACHAAPGPTRRNEPLYGPPGYAYVYLNYGIHYLVNAVTEARGSPAAVLIRALAPLDGVEAMARRRGITRGALADERTRMRIAQGPGNLTVAMGITLARNRSDLVDGPLRIEDRGIRPASLAFSPRIGIRVGTEAHWRCHWQGHPAVSGPRLSTKSRRRATGEPAARPAGSPSQ